MIEIVIETGIGEEIETEIMTDETGMIEEDEIDHPEGVTDQDHHTAETRIEIVHQKGTFFSSYDAPAEPFNAFAR